MIPLLCMECGTKFECSAEDPDPECPGCGSTDYEVDPVST